MEPLFNQINYDYTSLTAACARETNQDSVSAMVLDVNMQCAIRPSFKMKAGLFMVADGMGGGVAGDTASSITIKEFTKSFVSELFSSELEYDLEKFKKVIKENLVHAYEKSNKKVYKVAKKSGSVRDMGSTLVTAFSLGSWLITGNVGDSRAYILRKKSAELFTQDQSLVMQMVREGKLTYEQAMRHPQKNVILEAIGTAPHVNVDYRERDMTLEVTTKKGQRLTPSKLGQEDRVILLLCSDGLSDVVSNDQMRKVVFGVKTLDQAANELMRLAINNRTTDNVSVVLADLTSAINSFSTGQEPTRIRDAPTRIL